MTKELSYAEFKATFGLKMRDITDTIIDPIDIWPYVNLLADLFPRIRYSIDLQLVEKVYRNEEGKMDHVLIPSEVKNVFLVIVSRL